MRRWRMTVVSASVALGCLLSIVLAPSGYAAVPLLIDYQGRLTDASGTPVSSTKSMTFSIYSAASGGTPLWTETQTDVVVTGGIFGTALGKVTPLDPSLVTGTLYLGVAVSPDAEMTPRQRISSTAFSLRAGVSDSVAPGSVGTTGLADNAVTAPKIAAGAVTAAKLGEPCANGQLLKRVGGAWVCAADSDTTYTSGTGLTLVGTTFSLNTAATDGMYWRQGGNAGTVPGTNYVGTSDNNALELKVYGARGLRLEPTGSTPNVVGGDNTNAALAGSVGAAIAGGMRNTAGGKYPAVPGGDNNAATGDYSLAAGRRAKATHAGSFVWGDSTDADVPSPGDNTFTVRAAGGTTVYSDNTLTNGVKLLPGKGYWSSVGGGGGGFSIADNGAITFSSTQTFPTTIYAAGNGLALSGNTLSVDTGYTDNLYLKLGGNPGTAGGAKVLGSTDNVAVEVIAYGARALRIEPNATSPNVIGGYFGNSVAASIYGATIGGGGASGGPNHAGFYGTVGGGYNDNAYGYAATVAGGASNTSDGIYATVGGGAYNTASGTNATIPGGVFNTASGLVATVGGGERNITSSSHATVGGGGWNTASSLYATIGGGYANIASGNGGGAPTVGGGDQNTASNIYATVCGGYINTASGAFSSVPGGSLNLAAGDYSFAAGRRANANHAGAFVWGDSTAADVTSSGTNQFVARASGGVTFYSSSDLTKGSRLNPNSGAWESFGAAPESSTAWSLGGNAGTTAGTHYIGTSDNVALEFKVYGARALRIEPHAVSPNVIGGSASNSVSAGLEGATIGGGGNSTYPNRVRSMYGTVSGGNNNLADNTWATVGGGGSNTASGSYATVGGGASNIASGDSSTTGGGSNNTANAWTATVCGGTGNIAGFNATVGGGYYNQATGTSATVPGGSQSVASGNYSFAAGRRAKATNRGSFVWGDNYDGDVSSTANDQFTVRSQGGARFFTNSALTAGVTLAAGGGSWAPVSDRNMKENFVPVNGVEVLEKVSSLPLSTWNLKTQDSSFRHIGPMAQDFRAAFGVGDSEMAINTVDADGVALAAIQGLYERTKEQSAQILAQAAQIRTQAETIDKLLESREADSARVRELDEGRQRDARRIRDLESRLSVVEMTVNPLASASVDVAAR